MRLASAAIVLSGLALGACFTAQASEPQTSAPAEQSASNEVTVGIDAKTGKIRQLSASEIRALQVKAAAMPTNRTLGTRANRVMTPADARKTMRKSATGMSMRVPESAMSSMSVTQDTNGQLHFSESPDDQPAQAKQEVTE